MTCENLGSGQAAPRDERRAGHGRRGQVPQRSPAPTCSRRLPTSPRSARGGAAAAAHLCGRSVGGARPGPNMRRGSRPPPFHIMPGGCGGRARWGAAGAAAAARASFLQPPELRATPPWSLPRAAAGAGGPGAGGGRGAASSRAAGGRRGTARHGLGWLSADRLGRGSEGRASGASQTRGATEGAEPPFSFRCLFSFLVSRGRSVQMPYLCCSPSGAAFASVFVSAVAFRSGATRLALPAFLPGPSTCARIARRAHELLCTHRVLP